MTLFDKIAAWKAGCATSCGFDPDGPNVTLAMPDGSTALLTLKEMVHAYEAALKPNHGIARTKEQEWEMCYAELFRRLNPVMEENTRLKAELAALREGVQQP